MFSNFAGVKHEGQTREEFEAEMMEYVEFVGKPTVKLFCDCKQCGMKSKEFANTLETFELYFNTTKAQQKAAKHALINA